MTFELPKLNYALDGLQPNISKETLEYHYGKHHQGYVDKLNKLTNNLDQNKYNDANLFNVLQDHIADIRIPACMHWNHSLYWECLSPPSPRIAILLHVEKAIEDNFGSQQNFWDKFEKKVVDFFGSGWVWLLCDKSGKLELQSTHDEKIPNSILSGAKIPLLVCDVWEHSYYIDYKNERAAYFKAWAECVDPFRMNQKYQDILSKK